MILTAAPTERANVLNNSYIGTAVPYPKENSFSTEPKTHEEKTKKGILIIKS